MMFLRLYPRAWRARYQSEIVDLIECEDFAWAEVLDLARGAVREQARTLRVAILGDDERLTRGLSGVTELAMFWVLGGVLAVAALPVAFWLDAHGWHPASGLASWAIFAGLLPNLRGLLIMGLLGTETTPEARGSLAERLAVRWPETVLWATLGLVCAVVMRGQELANQHLASNASIDVVRPWTDTFLDGALRMQFIAFATVNAVSRTRRLRAIRADRKLALRTALKPRSGK
jgi:hypothetical protein